MFCCTLLYFIEKEIKLHCSLHGESLDLEKHLTLYVVKDIVICCRKTCGPNIAVHEVTFI